MTSTSLSSDSGMASSSCSSFVSNPRRILSSKSHSLALSEILPNYHPDAFSETDKRYRKPTYQRTLQKPVKWCIELVKSVIEGKVIGAVVISRWQEQKTDANNSIWIDNWYNVEDGQTRFDALLRFMKGDFIVEEYGSYENPEIRHIFDNYKVPVIEIEKANSQITNIEYFEALNDNFCMLQEGTPLSAADRYWVWLRDDANNFAGSPVINYALSLVTNNRFSHYFKNYLKIENISSSDQKTRKYITPLIALVSGALWGDKYSNEKYFKHVEILRKPINGEEKANTERLLELVFQTIEMAYERLPKFKNERIGERFNKPQKFTATMILDFRKTQHLLCKEKNHYESKVNDTREKWVTLINKVRYAHYKNDDKKNTWIVKNVYNNLSSGQIRNITLRDIEARCQAVDEWWEAQNNN